FNIPPWNYPGAETVATIPPGVVDWILIDLRDAPNAASAGYYTSVARKAGFVLADGTVIDISGSSQVPFYYSVIDNLFVVLWQRNHLPVLSANPLRNTGILYSYDFTTSANQAYGSSLGLVDLGGGKFGMYSGDGNSDGFVNNMDKIDIWNFQAGGHAYLGGDFNLDSRVNNSDKIDIWIVNGGHSSQVPE
ncbi:MAG: hypothetical protein K8R53_02530, partial [Bacteroidales bacterium]|nr:hypothetical protein [Bacteroidales bacterium]